MNVYYFKTKMKKFIKKIWLPFSILGILIASISTISLFLPIANFETSSKQKSDDYSFEQLSYPTNQSPTFFNFYDLENEIKSLDPNQTIVVNDSYQNQNYIFSFKDNLIYGHIFKNDFVFNWDQATVYASLDLFDNLSFYQASRISKTTIYKPSFDWFANNWNLPHQNFEDPTTVEFSDWKDWLKVDDPKRDFSLELLSLKKINPFLTKVTYRLVNNHFNFIFSKPKVFEINYQKSIQQFLENESLKIEKIIEENKLNPIPLDQRFKKWLEENGYNFKKFIKLTNLNYDQGNKVLTFSLETKDDQYIHQIKNFIWVEPQVIDPNSLKEIILKGKIDHIDSWIEVIDWRLEFLYSFEDDWLTLKDLKSKNLKIEELQNLKIKISLKSQYQFKDKNDFFDKTWNLSDFDSNYFWIDFLSLFQNQTEDKFSIDVANSSLEDFLDQIQLKGKVGVDFEIDDQNLDWKEAINKLSQKKIDHNFDLGYYVDDQNMYFWLSKKDFELWVNQKLSVKNNRVVDEEGREIYGWNAQEKFAYQPLPSLSYKPFFQKIIWGSFQVRYLTVSKKFQLLNSSPKLLNDHNVKAANDQLISFNLAPYFRFTGDLGKDFRFEEINVDDQSWRDKFKELNNVDFQNSDAEITVGFQILKRISLSNSDFDVVNVRFTLKNAIDWYNGKFINREGKIYNDDGNIVFNYKSTPMGSSLLPFDDVSIIKPDWPLIFQNYHSQSKLKYISDIAFAQKEYVKDIYNLNFDNFINVLKNVNFLMEENNGVNLVRLDGNTNHITLARLYLPANSHNQVWNYFNFQLSFNDGNPITEEQFIAMNIPDKYRDRVLSIKGFTPQDILEIFDGTSNANFFDYQLFDIPYNLRLIIEVKEGFNYWLDQTIKSSKPLSEFIGSSLKMFIDFELVPQIFNETPSKFSDLSQLNFFTGHSAHIEKFNYSLVRALENSIELLFSFSSVDSHLVNFKPNWLNFTQKFSVDFLINKVFNGIRHENGIANFWNPKYNLLKTIPMEVSFLFKESSPFKGFIESRNTTFTYQYNGDESESNTRKNVFSDTFKRYLDLDPLKTKIEAWKFDLDRPVYEKTNSNYFFMNNSFDDLMDYLNNMEQMGIYIKHEVFIDVHNDRVLSKTFLNEMIKFRFEHDLRRMAHYISISTTSNVFYYLASFDTKKYIDMTQSSGIRELFGAVNFYNDFVRMGRWTEENVKLSGDITNITMTNDNTISSGLKMFDLDFFNRVMLFGNYNFENQNNLLGQRTSFVDFKNKLNNVFKNANNGDKKKMLYRRFSYTLYNPKDPRIGYTKTHNGGNYLLQDDVRLYRPGSDNVKGFINNAQHSAALSSISVYGNLNQNFAFEVPEILTRSNLLRPGDGQLLQFSKDKGQKWENANLSSTSIVVDNNKTIPANRGQTISNLNADFGLMFRLVPIEDDSGTQYIDYFSNDYDSYIEKTQAYPYDFIKNDYQPYIVTLSLKNFTQIVNVEGLIFSAKWSTFSGRTNDNFSIKYLAAMVESTDLILDWKEALMDVNNNFDFSEKVMPMLRFRPNVIGTEWMNLYLAINDFEEWINNKLVIRNGKFYNSRNQIVKGYDGQDGRIYELGATQVSRYQKWKFKPGYVIEVVWGTIDPSTTKPNILHDPMIIWNTNYFGNDDYKQGREKISFYLDTESFNINQFFNPKGNTNDIKLDISEESLKDKLWTFFGFGKDLLIVKELLTIYYSFNEGKPATLEQTQAMQLSAQDAQLVQSKDWITFRELTDIFNKGKTSNFWDSTNWKWATDNKFTISLRVIDNDEIWIDNQFETLIKFDDLSWKKYIDLSQYDLSKAVLKGHSAKIVGIDYPSIPTNLLQHLKLEYTLNNGQKPTSEQIQMMNLGQFSYAWISEEQFIELFDLDQGQRKSNLWYAPTQKWAVTNTQLAFRFAQNPKLEFSNNSLTYLDLEQMTDFLKYIEVDDLVDRVKLEVKANIASEVSYHSKVIWNDISLLRDVIQKRGLSIEFSIFETVSYGPNANMWKVELPENVDFDHSKRFLWMQIRLNANVGDFSRFVLSSQEVHNLTESSNIRKVLSKIDISNTTLDQIIIKGDPKDPIIDESLANIGPDIKQYLIVRYHHKNANDENVFTDTKENFINALINSTDRLRGPPWTLYQNIGVSLQAKDQNKYYVDDHKIQIDVKDFYSYRDNLQYANLLVNSDFKFYGTIAVEDGFAFEVPVGLKTDILLKAGMALQYVIDENTTTTRVWKRVNLSEEEIQIGTNKIEANLGQLLSLPSGSLSIMFRLAPIMDESGYIFNDIDDYDKLRKSTKIHLWDYIESGRQYPRMVKKDLENLAAKIETDVGLSLPKVTGRTNDNVSIIEDDWQTKLKSANGNRDFSTYVMPGYRVKLNSLRQFNWFLRKKDFEDWINGKLRTSISNNIPVVINDTGNVIWAWRLDGINSFYDRLPANEAKPDYISKNSYMYHLSSIEYRWFVRKHQSIPVSQNWEISYFTIFNSIKLDLKFYVDIEGIIKEYNLKEKFYLKGNTKNIEQAIDDIDPIWERLKAFIGFNHDFGIITQEQINALNLSPEDAQFLIDNPKITEQQLLEIFNHQKQSNLWDHSKWQFAIQELIVGVFANDDYWADENIDNVKILNLDQQDTTIFKRYIDVKFFNLDNFAFTGHSANIEGFINNPITLKQSRDINLVFSFNNGQNPTQEQINNLGLEIIQNYYGQQELLDMFNYPATKRNLWFNSKWIVDVMSLKINLNQSSKGIFVLSSSIDDIDASIKLEEMTDFKKFIIIEQFIEQVQEIVKADLSIHRGKGVSNHESVHWLFEDLYNQFLNSLADNGLKIQFAKTDVKPEYGLNDQIWVTNKIPTSFPFLHNQRYLWTQILLNITINVERFVLSNQEVYDLTESSNLRKVQGLIRVDPYLKQALNNIKIMGDPVNPIIDESMMNIDPMHAPYLENYYSVYFDNGHGYYSNKKEVFLKSMQASTRIGADRWTYYRQVEVRFVIIDKSLFTTEYDDITNNRKPINNDEFYSFLRIDEAIQSFGTNVNPGIKISGTIGQENGFAFEVPAALETKKLFDSFGARLQYAINGLNWKFANLSIKTIPANPNLGIVEIPANRGQLITINTTVDNPIPNLYFRIVPVKDEGRNTRVNIEDLFEDYQDYVNLTMMHFSDYIDNNRIGPFLLKISTANLAKLVITVPEGQTSNLNDIILSGRTNDNFKINALINNKDWTEALKDLNQGVDFSQYVQLAFFVNDGRLSFWLNLNNFEQWINGRLRISNQHVIDPNNQVVKGWNQNDSFAYQNLPVTLQFPKWNSILLHGFEARWLSVKPKEYVPSASAKTRLNFFDIVLFIDTSDIELSFNPTGTTHTLGLNDDSLNINKYLNVYYSFNDRNTITDQQIRAFGFDLDTVDFIKSQVLGLRDFQLRALFKSSHKNYNFWNQETWNFNTDKFVVYVESNNSIRAWIKDDRKKLIDLNTINTWKRYVDVSRYDLSKIVLNGHSANIESINIDNILPSITQGDLTIHFSLNYGQKPTSNQIGLLKLEEGQIREWYSSQELMNIFSVNNINKSNLWNAIKQEWITTNFSLKIALVNNPSKFVLSNPNNISTKNLENIQTLKKYIDVEEFIEQIQTLTKVDLTNTGNLPTSTNKQLTWLNINEYNQLIREGILPTGLEIQYSTINTEPSYGIDDQVWNWKNDQPTSIAFKHSDRFLWAQIVLKITPQERFVLSSQKVLNLTNSSNITKVLGLIDVDSHWDSLSNIVITNNPVDPTIDEQAVSLEAEIVNYLSIGYVAKVTQNQDSKFENHTLLLDEMKASTININNLWYRYRVLSAYFNVNEPSLYITSKGNNQSVQIDVSNFYSFKIIDQQIGFLGTNNKPNIKVAGTLNSQNGVSFIVPETLQTNLLNQIGIKLQYGIDLKGWKNVNLSSSSIPANPTTGTEAIPANRGQLITVNTTADNPTPTLDFRFVPFEDENGVEHIANDQSSYQDWIKVTMMHLSDYVNNGNKHFSLSISTSTFAKLVITVPLDDETNLHQITLTGRTNDNFKIDILINNKDWKEALKDLNGGQDYSNFITIAFWVDDSSQNLWLESDAFEQWINGLLRIRRQEFERVIDQNDQIVSGFDSKNSFNPAFLSTQNYLPIWNNINLNQFKARWVTRFDQYRPTQSGETSLNGENIVKYLDTKNLIPNFNPSGNTHAFNPWKDDINSNNDLTNGLVWKYSFNNGQKATQSQAEAMNLNAEDTALIMSKNGLTQRELLGVFNVNKKSNLWNQQLWNFAIDNISAFLEVKIPDRYWIKLEENRLTNYTLTNITKPQDNFKRYVDVKAFDLTGVNLVGHSAKIDDINHPLNLIILRDLNLVFSLNGGDVPTTTQMQNMNLTGTIKNWLTPIELKAIFNGLTLANLWNNSLRSWGTKNFSVALRLVSTPSSFVLSAIDFGTILSLEAMLNFKKFINIESFVAKTQSDIKAITTRGQSDSDNVKWEKSANVLFDSLITNGLQINFSLDQTQPSYTSTSAWTLINQLPQKIQFEHNKRYLWAKVIPLDVLNERFVLSSKNVIDLTINSKIRQVLARINILDLDLSKIAFLDNTKNPFILEALIDLPEQISLVYWYITIADQRFSLNQFVTWSKTNYTKISRVDVRVGVNSITTDDAKYIIRPEDIIAKTTIPNIEAYYSYREVSDLVAALGKQEDKNIKIYGTLGQENGIIFQIPTSLTSTLLDKRGIILQYYTLENNWTNVDLEIEAYPGDSTTPKIEAGLWQRVTLIPPSDGTNPILNFRLIPSKNDKFIPPSPPVINPSNYSDWVFKTMVQNSDLIANNFNGPYVLKVDTGQLAILVITNTEVDSNLASIELTQHTRNLNVSELINGQTFDQILEILNPNKPNYSSYIKIAYFVNDQNLEYWLLKEDLVEWANGELEVNGNQVLNSQGNVVYGWKNQTFNYEPLPINQFRPKWNQIVVSSFEARWVSNDQKYIINSHSQTSIVRTNLLKWIDVGQFYQRLLTIAIEGHTQDLKSNDFSILLKNLHDQFGQGNIQIETTGYWNQGANLPDFNSPNVQINQLPLKINFLYQLYFRISVTTNNPGKLVIGTNSRPDWPNAYVTWDQDQANASQKIKKYIEGAIGTVLINNLILSGNTRDLKAKLDPQYLLSDLWGLLKANGTYAGLEVVYILVDVNFAGANIPRNLVDFNKWLKGITFDGSWGRDNIRVAYRALDGYAISQEVANLVWIPKQIDAVQRYIDIKRLIDQINQINVVGDVSKGGWWNPSTGLYDLLNYNGNSWEGYIDHLNLQWKIPQDIGDMGLSLHNLRAVIQFSVLANPEIESPQDWTNQAPLEIDFDHTKRYLWVRFVPGQVYDNGEIPFLSNNERHDIKTTSKITIVPSLIVVDDLDVNKVRFEGLTKNPQIIEQELGDLAIRNLKIEYSLTLFQDWTNSSDILSRLTKMGLTGANISQSRLKIAMNKDEFIIFNNAANQIASFKQFIRSYVFARLNVTSQLFTISIEDDQNSRKNPNIDLLYTWRDIGDLTSMLVFGNNPNTTIGLQGRRSIENGVAVSIPRNLTQAQLNLRGMALQYTLSSDDGINLADNASWISVSTQPIASGSKPGIINDIAYGFWITLTPKSEGNTFFALRIVPIINDLEEPIGQIVPTWMINEYFEKTKVKPQDHNKQDAKNAYIIDSSSIPTVIFTNSQFLTKMGLSGHTHKILIHEDDNGTDPGGNSIYSLIDTINSDSSLKNYLSILYAIDRIDGKGLSTEDDDAQAVWLTKDDLTAYLNGDLVFVNNKVVYKNDQTREVKALSPLKRSSPIYLNLNPDYVIAKWNSTNNNYILSDVKEAKIPIKAIKDMATGFRKWFDGERFRTAIKEVVVNGSTKAYTLTIKDLATDPTYPISPSQLTLHKLKLVYSLDNQTWVVNRPNYLSASWTIQEDRKLYLKVIPNNIGLSDVDYENEFVYIEYSDQTKSSQESNTQKFDANNQRLFKLYIDVNSFELSLLKILGNSYQVSDINGNQDLGLDESSVDNNQQKYAHIEIQYLYEGNWFNKIKLFEKMEQKRTLPKDSSLVLPFDFEHNDVQAKWVILDPKDAVLKDEQGLPTDIDASQFKTFVNIWMIQTDNRPIAELINGLNDYQLDGSINSANFEWKDGGNLNGGQAFGKYHMKAQWSLVQNPSQLLNHGDWKASFSSKNLIDRQPLDPQHKSLWIRFVPIDVNQHYLASQYEVDGSKVAMIKIDTSTMRYVVNVDSDVLEGLVVSGDTQSLFSASQENYLNGQEESIKYERVNADGEIELITDLNQRREWIKDVGLSIFYRVEATRTKGDYVARQVYTFETLEKFKLALNTKDLNFNRATLKIAWDIVAEKEEDYEVSDNLYVAPNSSQTLINVVYTEDITHLNSQSIEVSGNNLAINFKIIDQKIVSNNLNPLGVKIEYTTDASSSNPDQVASDASWSDQIPTRIPEHRGIWIRFAPFDQNYKLGSDDLDGQQVTKLNAAKIMVAIVLDQNWFDQFTQTSVSGKTYAIVWNNPYPNVPTSEDGAIHGKIQFAIVAKIDDKPLEWKDTLEELLKPYYSKNVNSLDKDRDQAIMIRYVILEEDLDEYQFTNDSGVVYDNEQLKRQIEINNLVQPIVIDWEDQRLPSNMSWKNFANHPDFKAIFGPGTSERFANLEKIQFNGFDVDQNGHSYFKLDQNIWNVRDILLRNIINALAPRHAHFEFSYRNTESSNWSPWSTIIPTDIIKSTIFPGLRIKIGPDQGYELTNGTGSPIEIELGDQNWMREFKIVVAVNPTGVKFKKAIYVGFDNDLGQGQFKTNDPNGDYNKGDLLIELANADGSVFEDLLNSPFYVLEYRVTNNQGQDLEWTSIDSSLQKETKSGWHSYERAPSAEEFVFGMIPISLKNGQVVRARLRARNGYVIVDPNSDDPIKNDPNWNGYVSWSGEIVFDAVNGLDKEIVLPQNFGFFDLKNLLDLDGQQITYVDNMPTISFSGNEDNGEMTINTNDLPIVNTFDIKSLLLSPIVPDNGSIINFLSANQKPTLGYWYIDAQNQKHVAYLTAQGKSSLYPDLEVGWQPSVFELPNVWSDPNKYTNLYVGQAVLLRLFAKEGYGFRWQDPNLNFENINFPKKISQEIFNQGGVLGQNQYGQNQTPIPIRGLFLFPDTYASKEHLVYSDIPEERLNGNAYISISGPSTLGQKWRWSFDILRLSGNNSLDQISIPIDVVNGDQVAVQMVVRNNAYAFHPDYITLNTKITFTISTLLDRINSEWVPRPEFTIGGYVGKGTIIAVNEHNTGGEWVEYDRSDNTKLPQPKIHSSHDSRNGVRWEFQLSNQDPNNISASEINLLPWTSQVPKTLNIGVWVRMRLGANSNEDVVYEKVYSYGQTDQQDPNAPEHMQGWNQTKNLTIDPKNVDIEVKIEGFNQKTSLVLTHNQTLDANGLEFEASVDNVTFSPLNTFDKLKNGDQVWIRGYPKESYQLSPNDNDPSQGIHVVIINANKTAMWKDDWAQILVEGLKSYLYVDRVDVSDVQVIRMDTHPPNDNEGNPYPANVILSGWATITASQILQGDTIADLDGNKNDSQGQPFANKVKIRYVWRKYDPDSGNYSEPIVNVNVPRNLSNNDQVKIELYSIDDDYRLSKEVSKTITITGLVQPPPENQQPPQISFIGENGHGSVVVTPVAIKGYRWVYALTRRGDPFPEKEEDIVWSNDPPIDLINGDYVMVELASSIPGAELEDTFRTNWILVSGLAQEIDLSNIKVMVFDKVNPYDPIREVGENVLFNVALKIIGEHENQASIAINSPLVSENSLEQLVDLDGKEIPNNHLLQWKFYVSYNETPPELERFSYALPQGLKNGMYVHVLLDVKQGSENIRARGYAPFSFKVDFLLEEASISNQLVTMILLIATGAIVVGLILVTVLVLRRRRRRLT